MRIVKLLGAYLIIFGGCYWLDGVATFLGPLRMKSLSDLLPALLEGFAIVTLDFLIGASLVVVGVGLLLAREWARQAWLATSVILALVHLCLGILYYLSVGNYRFQFVIFAQVSLLATVSWMYLTKLKVKNLFG